jgi:carbamoyl-phosphate synthase small subunit
MKALLILEDGTTIEGGGFGAEGKVKGEIVFATGMTGYVESLTDPSYTGQILMFTYPLIGNYGVNQKDYESDGIKVQGLVVREFCLYPSNWRSQKNIDEFLSEFNVPGIFGVDTRALTRKIREQGTMKCILKTYTHDRINLDALKKEAKEQKSISELNLVEEVTSKQIKRMGSGSHEVVLIDCGCKRSILSNLLSKGISVTIVPFNTPAEEILSFNPDAVLISNGPGDPSVVRETIENVKKLIGKVKLYGICLGHQIIALALGAKTFKLKFGHRGLNHPVGDLKTGRVFISTQNHGFAVLNDDLEGIGLKVTQVNLNDNTIEGLEHKGLSIKTVQYHPEAGPGPHDTYFFFESLLEDIKDAKEN